MLFVALLYGQQYSYITQYFQYFNQNTWYCIDFQLQGIAHSYCAVMVVIREDVQATPRGGTTSVRPEVHGEELAVTTCHMIS